MGCDLRIVPSPENDLHNMAAGLRLPWLLRLFRLTGRLSAEVDNHIRQEHRAKQLIAAFRHEHAGQFGANGPERLISLLRVADDDPPIALLDTLAKTDENPSLMLMDRLVLASFHKVQLFRNPPMRWRGILH